MEIRTLPPRIKLKILALEVELDINSHYTVNML
jgi:hypothetical protein